MSVASFNNEYFGANIRFVDQAGSGQGSNIPQIKPGTVVTGDNGGEFIYVSMSLAAGAVLSDGLAVVYDNNYQGALLYAATAGGTVALPTANSNIKGACVGIVRVSPTFTAPTAATYYLWVQRAGMAPVAAASGSVGGNLVNTTSSTTPGVLDGNATATNAGARQVTGLTFVPTAAPSFSVTTTNGSASLTGVNLSAVGQGVFVGQAIAGTGIPAGALIGAIQAGQNASFPLGNVPAGYPGSLTNATLLLVNSSGAPVTATASGTVTATVSGLQEAYVNWPYLA